MYLRYILKIEKSSSLSWRTLFKYNNENNMWKNNVNSSTWWNENNINLSIFWKVKNRKVLLLRILDEGDKSPEIIDVFLEKYKNIISGKIIIHELIEKSLSYRWKELTKGVENSVNPVRKMEKNLTKTKRSIRERILSRMDQLWLKENIIGVSHSIDNNNNWKVTLQPETIIINQDMVEALKKRYSDQKKT